MPNPIHTLIDIQKMNAPAYDTRVVEDVIIYTPVFSKLPARTISGTTFKYRIRKSIPKCGFRPANKGVGLHKSDYEQKVGQCFLLSGVIAIDEGVLAQDERGEAQLMYEEAQAHTKGTLFALEQQLFYGTKMDPNGFEGFDQSIGDYMTISADKDANVADAVLEESGASIWFLSLKPDKLEVDWGNKSGIAFSKAGRQLVTDADGNSFPAAYQTLTALVGMTVRSEYALGRIRNESDDNPASDNLLAKGLALFPAGENPDLIVMPRASLERLRQSRAALSTFVKGVSDETAYAKTPTEFEGIPIVCSDALLEDETPQNIAKAAKAAIVARKNLNTPKR